jgi:hypothetical protein
VIEAGLLRVSIMTAATTTTMETQEGTEEHHLTEDYSHVKKRKENFSKPCPF